MNGVVTLVTICSVNGQRRCADNRSGLGSKRYITARIGRFSIYCNIVCSSIYQFTSRNREKTFQSTKVKHINYTCLLSLSNSCIVFSTFRSRIRAQRGIYRDRSSINRGKNKVKSCFACHLIFVAIVTDCRSCISIYR